MDAREAKQVLEDLEPKVERLKALYQQYFMGIEKIPPHVLRKDVERTIWLLRRTRFQNTQLRFKFQQIIQRYNTYGQYWARILREIEKGTYKRDLVRAAKRFGKDGIVEGGRGAEAALRSLHLDEEEGADRERPQVWDITEGMDDGFDVSELDDIPTPPNMSVSPQSYQDPRAWSFSSSPPAPDHAGYPAYPSQSYGDQGYPAQSYPAAQDYQAQGYQAEAYQAEGYQAQGYQAQGYQAQGYQAQGYQAQGSPEPGYPSQAYPAPSYPAQAYPGQAYPAQAYPAQTHPDRASPGEAEPYAPPQAAAPGPRPAPRRAPTSAPHLEAANAISGTVPTVPHARRIPAPKAPVSTRRGVGESSPPPAPYPPARPLAPSAGRPLPPPPGRPLPPPPGRGPLPPPPPRREGGGPAAASPAAASPAAASPAAASPAAAKPAPASPGPRPAPPASKPEPRPISKSGSNLFKDRKKRPKPEAGGEEARQVYESYLEARRAAGQSTSNLSYERVAASLEKQREKLQKTHGRDKKVDFEVVTKDGKPMIRPVVK